MQRECTHNIGYAVSTTFENGEFKTIHHCLECAKNFVYEQNEKREVKILVPYFDGIEHLYDSYRVCMGYGVDRELAINTFIAEVNEFAKINEDREKVLELK